MKPTDLKTPVLTVIRVEEHVCAWATEWDAIKQLYVDTLEHVTEIAECHNIPIAEALDAMAVAVSTDKALSNEDLRMNAIAAILISRDVFAGKITLADLASARNPTLVIKCNVRARNAICGAVAVVRLDDKAFRTMLCGKSKAQRKITNEIITQFDGALMVARTYTPSFEHATVH